MDDDGYTTKTWWKAGGFGQFNEPDDWEDQSPYFNRPVHSVSWYEAAAFCAWMGGRLPSEAEWERAARGADGRKFAWEKEPADASRLNFDGNIGSVTPVGIYPRGSTPDGICDLCGNVWEWCQDWFGPYGKRKTKNPRGAKKGEWCVLRGGSWDGGARDCRAAIRLRYLPELRNNDVGFRVLYSRQDLP